MKSVISKLTLLSMLVAASIPVSAVHATMKVIGQPTDERASQEALPQADDPLWAVLRHTKIGEDAKRGLYTASFPADVKALDGQTVSLTGFMLPIDTWTKTRHFLLSRYTPVCFFCPPGEPNEVVEVLTKGGMPVTSSMITVSGRLSLINNAEKGLFFQMVDSAVR